MVFIPALVAASTPAPMAECIPGLAVVFILVLEGDFIQGLAAVFTPVLMAACILGLAVAFILVRGADFIRGLAVVFIRGLTVVSIPAGPSIHSYLINPRGTSSCRS